MPDIKLIIKISEEDYLTFSELSEKEKINDLSYYERVIANGTPLKRELDKIRSEILEEKECAYANFEAYKIDYLMQDEEDVLDSLPQDDFRYGMERAIEIIDKYKAES
jgi:hypothetical protein